MIRPLLLGHRGARARKDIPENTPASFDRALADGCDGFEFDVRLTADEQAIVCHDPKIAGLQIARAAGEQLPAVPRLENILARYREAFLDIELKVRGLDRIVIPLMRGRSPESVVISSFLPDVLKAVHALEAGLPLGLICETKRQLERWRTLPVHYVIPHFPLVRRALIDEIHAANKKVLVWTVNRAPMMKRFAAWGVDGIISDDTSLLAKTLQG